MTTKAEVMQKLHDVQLAAARKQGRADALRDIRALFETPLITRREQGEMVRIYVGG